MSGPSFSVSPRSLLTICIILMVSSGFVPGAEGSATKTNGFGSNSILRRASTSKLHTGCVPSVSRKYRKKQLTMCGRKRRLSRRVIRHNEFGFHQSLNKAFKGGNSNLYSSDPFMKTEVFDISKVDLSTVREVMRYEIITA